MSSQAKVQLALPTHGLMPACTTMALLKMISFDKEANNFIRFSINKGMSVIHWSRNSMVRDFLELRKQGSGLTHLLFVDSDMVPEPDGLLKLVECDADIAAGLFTTRDCPPVPVLRRLKDNKLEQIPLSEIPNSEEALEEADVFPVDATGMAFTLIKAEVFEKMADPWFGFDAIPGHAPYEYGEDVTFCLRAKEAAAAVSSSK